MNPSVRTNSDLHTRLTTQWGLADLKLRTKIVMGVVLAPLLIPFPETVAPMIEVTVVDKSNNPVPGAKIHQTWQHYTLEASDNDEYKVTNEFGKATFDKRTIWSNYLWRILGGVGGFLSAGIHASFGPSSSIFANHDCFSGSLFPHDPITLVLNRRMRTKECLVVVQGTATVIDGETLEIDGQRIRLVGVDALEDGQLCDDGSKEWACGRTA